MAMKRNLKHRLCVSLCTIAWLCTSFVSCQSEEETIVDEPFVVKNIEYVFEEGDGESMFEQELDTVVYVNQGNQSRYVEWRPYDGFYLETTFSSDDPNAFTWRTEGDTIMVKDIFVLSGEPYANDAGYIPYLNETVQRTPNVSIKEGTTLHPDTKLTCTGTIIFQKIIATYLLDIEGVYTGTLQTIKGKITKTEPYSLHSEVVYEAL